MIIGSSIGATGIECDGARGRCLQRFWPRWAKDMAPELARRRAREQGWSCPPDEPRDLCPAHRPDGPSSSSSSKASRFQRLWRAVIETSAEGAEAQAHIASCSYCQASELGDICAENERLRLQHVAAVDRFIAAGGSAPNTEGGTR